MSGRRRELWDAFASREPYFAVLTEPRFLRAHFDAAAEAAFFQGGDAYVSDLYGTVQARIAPHFAPRTVLEYGCGPGRLLIPFARRAEKVTGVDIAPSMLATVRLHLARSGSDNVELVTPDAMEGDPRVFDLVNCHLVLQRLRRDEGMALLQSLVQRVREGGVAVFQLPYRLRVSHPLVLARAARAHLPGMNRLANLLLRKPATTPFIESNVYDLNAVLGVLQENHFEAPYLVFTRHGDLDGVIIHALRKWHGGPLTAPPEPQAPARTNAAPDVIDVRKLIAETPLEELNRTAEQYFASLSTWEHHLAKPFARVEDSPQLLISVGAVLQGLRLTPGLTVLEFGAGTGWLARFLTQLGCRMILLDVAPTALEIARELYRRQPPIGERPAPEFLVFDGLHIDLPDGSVDRILCFDAFHHATDPEAVLREFGRVLRPGGIAGFAEPGPRHSLSPQSQYEMRTYGVVEADIDIHAIWTVAHKLGFAELSLAAFHVPPFHVSLADHDDLLAGGETFGRWAEATRSFLRDTRMFFLTKAGQQKNDSRTAEGLRAAITAAIGDAVADQPVAIHITVRNIGKTAWLPSSEPYGGVTIGAHLHGSDGRLLELDWWRAAVPQALDVGEEAAFDAMLPPLPAGTYVVELDCVSENVAWFAQLGSDARALSVEVTPAP